MKDAEARANGSTVGGLGFLVGVVAAMSSMIVLQLGASLSKPAMEAYGALQITWLRLMWAAVLLLVFVRPKVLSYSRLQWKTALLLGAAISVTNLCYYQSLLHLPIGIATSLEFIGPLSVSAFYLVRVNRARIVWPAFASIGVLLLTTRQSSGGRFLVDWAEADALGVTWALAAAFGWGSYVVFMKRTGNVFSGLEGLTMSLAAATAISAPFGLLGPGEGISVEAVRAAFGLAILVPLLPYTLEMLALRRMHARVFAILMGVEPVISVIIGWIVLSQSLTTAQLAGVALVTIAILKVTQPKSDVA
ncbi:MAG TPA: EamA family transporter [Stellaceae bacterium]|nr:EamA family transporter [Stellaceae bacterium]